MTREESIAILDGFKHNPLFNQQHFEALDMAISALSKNKGEGRPKGLWKIHDLERHLYRCSECQTLTQIRFYFCPNCGADMRGET